MSNVETVSSWTRYAGAGSHRVADGVTYHAGRRIVQENQPTKYRHAGEHGNIATDRAGTSASTPNHYRLLGLAPDATSEEIERVYRRSVARIHPDKYSTDPQLHALAEQKMKQLNVAIQVLRDPARRIQYDESLTGRSLVGSPLTRRLQGSTRERSLGSGGE